MNSRLDTDNGIVIGYFTLFPFVYAQTRHDPASFEH